MYSIPLITISAETLHDISLKLSIVIHNIKPKMHTVTAEVVYR